MFTLENALPKNRRIFSEQFELLNPNSEAVKPLKFAAFEHPTLIESIVIEAYDAVMIPNPTVGAPPIPQKTKAITPDRTDRDRILVVMERTNNDPVIISTGGLNTRMIDMFAFNELFKIGRNKGWEFPEKTELMFRLRHQNIGTESACGFPIKGSVTISLFYDIP